MNHAQWPGRRVMVTGGGGFLGQAIVRRLEAGSADPITVPASRDYDPRTPSSHWSRSVRRTSGTATPVNLGVGHEIAIRELVELVALLTRFEGEVRWDPSKPDGQPRRALDTSTARELFGFEASTTPEVGLRRTIDWHEVSRQAVQEALSR